MDEREKKKKFQLIKSWTVDRFWRWVNSNRTYGYELAKDHIRDAMSCHPRITRPMIKQVMEKADKIREEWDGIGTVDVAVEEVNVRNPTQMAYKLEVMEAAIYDLTEPHLVRIADKTFVVRPATKEEIAEERKKSRRKNK